MLKPVVSPQLDTLAGTRGVIAGWDQSWSIVNLRGNPDDPSFCAGVSRALGAELPVAACSTHLSKDLKIVWAGPDDWFVMSRERHAADLERALRSELAGQHIAVTDVSSNYSVMHLSGPSVREMLAQGCPLNLNPRHFRTGQSAGSVFFKASVWLWQADDAPTFEVLVRNSFRGYVWLMLEQCTVETGMVKRVFA
jgi:sarcosine oxidase subunit gamma